MKYTKKHFNTCISPNNKLAKYMSFTKDDKVLRDFIDYLSFYTSRNHDVLLRLLASDNGPSVYLGRLSVDCIDNKIWLFRAWISTSYMWMSVKICQLREMKIKDKVVLKVDIYWKWLKLLREDKDLRNSLRLFFSDWLCLWEDLTVCRIDYTVDCMKYNFKKPNTLRSRAYVPMYMDGAVKTKYFGIKWHDSAMFLRYYDKKWEINDRWTSLLYPEYQFLKEVMRYELQVNSKWLDPCERYIKLSNLYDLINLGYDIKLNSWSHVKKKEETSYSIIVSEINKLRNAKDYEWLNKVYIYLENVFTKKKLITPVSCEEFLLSNL